MVFLIIVGIILLLIAAILLLRIRFDIIANEEICLRLKILGLKIPLYPAKEKKVDIKKFKKGYPKDNPRREKKKKEIVSSPQKSDEEKTPLGDIISTVLSLVRSLLSRFFKHLRLDISKIIVVVGSSDAASCAITYGIISQSVAYLLQFLDNNLNISKKRSGEINVLCDFTAEDIKYDIFISASITVWQILDIGIRLAYNYFKGKDIFKIKKALIGGHKDDGGKQN